MNSVQPLHKVSYICSLSGTGQHDDVPQRRQVCRSRLRMIRMTEKKILFLHGFFASGRCGPATALRECFAGRATVLSPDLPLHPEAALDFIAELCDREHPDVIAGNSNGSFLGQIIASRTGIPALLGNPYFEMTRFLEERTGTHFYKSPREDGKQELVIDRKLIEEFAAVQEHQWDSFNPLYTDRIWGLFGDRDPIAHFEPVFLERYTTAFRFPGAHTPTAEEVREWYAPLVQKLLDKDIRI